jgi:hypothetical protein
MKIRQPAVVHMYTAEIIIFTAVFVVARGEKIRLRSCKYVCS